MTGTIDNQAPDVLCPAPFRGEIDSDPVVSVGSFCPPLDRAKPCIRVLDLQAGKPEDEIECRYRIRDLDDGEGVGYETLSYCWGPLTEHRTIRVEGHRVEVTDNLYSALQNLRFADRNRLIWIDAICINQDDTAEKEVQVNMMRRVYTECTSCSCWLGDFRRRMEPIQMERAQGVVDLIQFLNDDCSGPCPATITTQSQRLAVGAALRIMMDEAWWHRIWTVQEVVLPSSSNLVWGPFYIPWKSMIYAQGFLVNSPGISKAKSPINLWDFFRPARTTYFLTVPIHSLKTIALESSTPVDLFFRFRSRSATDPRDKIYGLMGLMHKIGFERIKSANYSLDIVSLLKIVSLEMIQIDCLQNWVSRSGEPHTLPGLPSWATDLTRDDMNQTIDGLFWWEHRFAYDRFNADGRHAKNWMYNVDGNKTHLILKGAKFDWIIHVIKPIITELPDPSSTQTEQIAAVDAQIKHWRIAVQEFLNDLKTKVKVSDEDVARVWSSFEKASTGNLSDQPLEATAVEKWKLEILRFKALAITNEGEVGLVPRTSEFGDEIHVAIGGRVPFVMRPIRSMPENPGVVPGMKVGQQMVGIKTLVGDCYVNGAMKGEILKGKKDDELDWIVLR
ncbi:heterokaryon incompatibility protein-domain-containing protein [Xylaria cubensis]|nr:heterokaryon incompatibility protein-domain-containing protein [Xylaria cubensis]